MSDAPRARILAAARELLADPERRNHVSIGAVAASARVSRATVYRHFPDKAALLGAALGTQAEQGPPADPRTRILQTALEVFGERGVHGATLAEIAERAEISLSGLHWHFRNKEELVNAVAQQAPPMGTLIAELGKAGGEDADLEGQLTQVALTLLRFIQTRRSLIRFQIVEAPIYPDVARLATTYTLGRALSLLTTLFERHAARGRLRPGDARVRAQAFVSMFGMLGLLRPAFDSVLAPDDLETAREYVRILVRGVLAEGAEAMA